MTRLTLISVLLGTLLLAACTTPGMRVNNANRLAMPVFMYPRALTVDGYQIRLYERTHQKDAVASVYFEDSGAVLNRGFNPMKDPTPSNPVGLAMAAQDRASNVIYVARPCQYGMKKVGADTCPTDILLGQQFSPTMITLYNRILDELKARYQITAFHLNGYGTGGGLAAILASERSDVMSLRTVAGVLDSQMYAAHHGLKGFEASINPVSRVPQLVDMPQHHYLGQLDDVVPNDIYHSFAQAFGDNRCLNHTIVQNVDHTYDWPDAWGGFAQDPVTCLGWQRPRIQVPVTVESPATLPTTDAPTTPAPTTAAPAERRGFMKPLFGQ